MAFPPTDSTRLHFGTAQVPTADAKAAKRYSRALLAAAKSRLARQ